MSKPIRVPSLRHHRPSGRAVVTLDGRDYYLGRFGSQESKAEYQRLLPEFLSGGLKTALNAVTLAMAMDCPAVTAMPESLSVPAPGSVVIVTAVNALAGLSEASLKPKSAAVNV